MRRHEVAKQAKAKKVKVKRPKLTDAQLAQRMRDQVSGSQAKVDKALQAADVLEQHGRKALRLVQRRDKLAEQLGRIDARLCEIGIG
jgi:hypothetical protein